MNALVTGDIGSTKLRVHSFHFGSEAHTSDGRGEATRKKPRWRDHTKAANHAMLLFVRQ